ncbi:MAG: T9SS type A sorting domain-containing protein [Bacteroidetes bacterium]|nr:T9SS type A sorting domain-containing protein [Bacteroidota bacterium]
MRVTLLYVWLFSFATSFGQNAWFKHLPGWRAKSTIVINDTLLTCGMNSWDDKFGHKLGTFLTWNSIKGDSVDYYKINLDSLEMDSSRSTTISYKYASSVLIGVRPSFFLGLSYGDKKERAFLFTLDKFHTNNYKLKEHTVDTFNTYINNLVYNPSCNILFLPYVLYTKPLETEVNTVIYRERDGIRVKINEINNSSSYKYETNCHIKNTKSDKSFFFIKRQMWDYAGAPRMWADYIIKMDTNGNQLWQCYPNNRDSINTEGMQIVQKPNGNLLVSWCDFWYRPYKNMIGSQQPQLNRKCTIWFAEIDSSGKVLWRKNIRNYLIGKIKDTTQSLEHNRAIVTKNSVIWTGNYSYYYDHNYLLKTDFDGNPIWYREYELYPNNTAWQEFKSYDVTATSDGGYVLTGEYISDKGNIFKNGCQLATIIKVDSFGCLEPGCQKNDSLVGVKTLPKPVCKLYPNPANETIHIELPKSKNGDYLLEVYDMQGRMIEKMSINTSLELNTSKYANGFILLYILNSESGEFETHRIQMNHTK